MGVPETLNHFVSATKMV